MSTQSTQSTQLLTQFGSSHPVDRSQVAASSKDVSDLGGEACTSGMQIALIIVAALGAAGIIGGVGAGGAILGLAIPLLILNVLRAIQASNKKNKPEEPEVVSAFARAVIHALAIVLGALAITGTLSIATGGIVVAATAALALLIRCVVDYKFKGDFGKGLATSTTELIGKTRDRLAERDQEYQVFDPRGPGQQAGAQQ